MPLSEKEKKTIIDFFELLLKISRRENEKPPEIKGEHEEDKKRLIPLVKWNDFHPFPTVSQLRWYRYNGHKNGFNKCLRKMGRRLFIVEDELFKWVDEQKN